MPDRAQLAERDQREALRRSSRAAGVDASAPVVDEAAVAREAALALPKPAGSGDARAQGAGMPRGMSPAMLMSMQRFAGNRATVQAVGLFQKATTAGKKVDEEDPLAEASGAGPEAKPPKETSAAAGPPDGGGAGGGTTPPPDGGTGGADDLPKPGDLSKPTDTDLPKPGDLSKPAPAGGSPKPGPGAGLKPGAKPGAGGGAPKPGGSDHVLPPGPTGPTGPTPPASAPTGPHGLPDPETAKSGIDWNQILSDYGPPVRTVLEVGRLIPGFGLLSGFGADALNFQSDIAAIPKSENAGLATGLIVFRNVLNIGNNAVGHLLYVDQLIQDAIAGSVVGSEFTFLTAAANEVLSGVKVGLDEVQMGTDIIIEVEALYESNHAPTSPEAEQWKQLADGYAANLAGDVVTMTLDVISLASLGASNTGAVQQAREPLTMASFFLKTVVPNIIGGINGVLGVWLGNIITAGRHDLYEGSPTELREKAAVFDLAGMYVEGEGGQARTTYTAVDAVIGAFEEYANQQVEQLNTITEALSGGKTAFQLIRDAVQAGLEDMQGKLAMVEQLSSLASSAKANADMISSTSATILGALDRLVIPDYHLPEVELGDGLVADSAEWLANQATAAANRMIRAKIADLNGRIEVIKMTVRAPVEAAHEKADALGEWLALLAEECGAMAGTLSHYISKFSYGLERCTNAEQVMDLIIGQVSDLTGMPAFTVQDMRDTWHSIGTYIDQFVALGQGLRQQATDLRQFADAKESGSEATPSFAPPPPLLPPGSGTGTGAGPGGPPGPGGTGSPPVEHKSEAA